MAKYYYTKHEIEISHRVQKGEREKSEKPYQTKVTAKGYKSFKVIINGEGKEEFVGIPPTVKMAKGVYGIDSIGSSGRTTSWIYRASGRTYSEWDDDDGYVDVGYYAQPITLDKIEYGGMGGSDYITDKKKVAGDKLSSFVDEEGSYPIDGIKGNYWYKRGEKLNKAPALSDKTVSGKTLYEQNILNINGSATDTDANDVVSVKYRVNSGTIRPLSTGIGSASYNKSLQFRQGYLYDADTKITSQLSDGTQHNIRLWAEDDKGAKSEEVIITFYVVNNRPSKLQINQILEQKDLVESDTVLLTGRVEDPEGHDTTISYRIGGSSYTKVNTGKDRDFEVRIPVSKLINGENLVTIKSEDTYGAITERTARLTKSGISTPLKTGVIEYKMTSPEGSAKGLLIWIQREIGDLSTKVEVKFGDSPYKTLEKNHVGLVTEGLEEDEYVYENETAESDIRLRITMSRVSTNSNKAIKKISGVFN